MIEIPYYSPNPGDRIRILLYDGLNWRPIFWIKIQSDGSIYLGPRKKNISEIKIGSKTIEGKPITFNYEDGQVVTDPKALLGKISFHASGIIHSPGKRTFRESLRKIKNQQEICRMLFQHPKFFIPDPKIKKRDICLKYPIDEDYPLQGLLLVAPKGGLKIIQINDSKYQINLILEYANLDGVPDIFLQLVLFHSARGPWPPSTYLLYGASQ